MKPFFLSVFAGAVLSLLVSCSFQPRAEWVTTTDSATWMRQPDILSASLDTVPVIDVTICTDEPQQRIEGFGACFNELGWLSLNKLAPSAREDIMQELFYPDEGANFTICRMPIGANDFSRDWYSYDETEGDFEMKNFTVANDLQTLIPFIRNAQKYQPDLQVWASPWSPPAWMKYNKHYASVPSRPTMEEKYRNDLPADRTGREGTDMFIQDSSYLQAYALYFAKFVDAYKEQGIPVFAVMPQNEFNSAQPFPSCCWTAAGLARFIGQYLGPALEDKDVEILFGTMERGNELLVDTILTDSLCRNYVKGVGFQWDGKKAIGGIHKRYPKMKIYQTEQECGNGKNDWQGAMYSWSLMQHYLNNGASAYMYWNISLDEGGISRWGWAQNSLVVVNPDNNTYRYTPEYFVMKHVSHYVQPGARKLMTDGAFTNLLAFRNPDGSIVVALANEAGEERVVSIRVDDRVYQPRLRAHSISTLLID